MMIITLLHDVLEEVIQPDEHILFIYKARALCKNIYSKNVVLKQLSCSIVLLSQPHIVYIMAY